MSDIFLSYASEDVDRVRGLVAALESEGWSVWWDRVLKPGETWPSVIERQLKRARCVVVVWSEAAIRSPWVRLEANKARERNILVPILLEDVQVPPEFGAVQLVSVIDDPEQGRPVLIDGVRSLLRRRSMRQYFLAAGSVGIVTAIALSSACLTRDGCNVLSNLFPGDDIPAGSVAVLSFDNQLGNPQLAEIADVFVDELRETLAEADQQQVAARSATRALPNALEPTEVGDRLRVRWLVAGSVTDFQDQIEIAMEVIDARTGYLRKSKRYVVVPSDLARLRRDIAADVLATIGAEGALAPDDSESESQASSEAYVLYLRGKSQLRQQDVDEAEDYFRQAQALAPAYPEADAGLCQVFLSRFEAGRDSGDFETAKSHCNRALSARRRSMDAGLALGDLQLLAGNLDEAEDSFSEALLLNSSSADAYIGLARVSQEQDRPDDAEILLRQATIVQRGYWRPFNELGIFLVEQGRIEDAQSSFDRALALAPEDGTVLNNLAVTYLMIDDLDHAIDAWKRVLQLEPSATAYGNLGSAYYWAGDLEQAVTMYEEAARLHPEDFRWWSNLGDAQLHLAHAEALVSFQRALEQTDAELAVNPANVDVHVGRAPLLAALDRNEEARAILNAEEAAISHRPELAYLAAVTAVRLGDMGAARHYLAITRSLGYPEVLIRADPTFAVLKDTSATSNQETHQRRTQ